MVVVAAFGASAVGSGGDGSVACEVGCVGGVVVFVAETAGVLTLPSGGAFTPLRNGFGDLDSAGATQCRPRCC